MKKIIIVAMCVVSTFTLVAQETVPKKYSPMEIFMSSDRLLPQYIPYDYIRDDYKRPQNIEVDTNDSAFISGLKTVEIHMDMYYSYGIHNNTFKMDNIFLNIAKTFDTKYFSITPFITINGFFDTHNFKEDYDFIKNNIGLYDGGVQFVALNNILISLRGRATFDVNTTTYMLMPHYIDRKNPTSYDAPHWYIPIALNGPGIRVGFIGNNTELAYSQGDYRHSIPKAVMFRLNLPNLLVRLLYQHENRENPSIYTEDIFESLVQASLVYRKPFSLFTHGGPLWLNLIAEYTWRENDAQYVRLEQSLEWNIINIAFRELFYISKDTNEEVFLLEYSLYLKFKALTSEFSVGYQGSTDNRHYLLGKISF